MTMRKTTVAQALREQSAEYKSVKENGIAGILSTLLGNIPDNVLSRLINLRELVNISFSELERLPGIGPSKALRLMAAKELAVLLAAAPPQTEKYTISDPKDVADLVMTEMRYLEKEQLRVLHLNVKNQVTGQEIISEGTINTTPVYPREVFRNALKANAVRIILLHNHPSGDPSISKEDIAITKKIYEAGKLVGIDVLDHVIIGDGKFESVLAKGLI